MKEINELLSLLTNTELKKSTCMDAGVGGSIGNSQLTLAKSALIGAGVGLALGCLLTQRDAHQDKKIATKATESAIKK